jgi:hypothetical protein
MILMGLNPLLGPYGWVGPENLTFLGQSLDFQDPLLPVTLEIDLPASKSLRLTPYKQQAPGTSIFKIYFTEVLRR